MKLIYQKLQHLSMQPPLLVETVVSIAEARDPLGHPCAEYRRPLLL